VSAEEPLDHFARSRGYLSDAHC